MASATRHCGFCLDIVITCTIGPWHRREKRALRGSPRRHTEIQTANASKRAVELFRGKLKARWTRTGRLSSPIIDTEKFQGKDNRTTIEEALTEGFHGSARSCLLVFGQQGPVGRLALPALTEAPAPNETDLYSDKITAAKPDVSVFLSPRCVAKQGRPVSVLSCATVGTSVFMLRSCFASVRHFLNRDPCENSAAHRPDCRAVWSFSSH